MKNKKIKIFFLICILLQSNIFASTILKNKNEVVHYEKNQNNESEKVSIDEGDEKFIAIKEKFIITSNKLYSEFVRDYDLQDDKIEKDDIFVKYSNKVNEVYGAMPSQIFSIALNYKISHEKTDVWNMEIKKIYEETVKKINDYIGRDEKND